MCFEQVKLSEVKLALEQMEKQTINTSDFIMKWKEVLEQKGINQFNYELRESAQLAEQLRKDLHNIIMKLIRFQDNELSNYTISKPSLND